MTKDTITRNFLDTPSYWREYPDRDIEFVRWYPCDVKRLSPEQLFARREAPPQDVSFYIHIPFCNQVCTSCPYNKFHTRNTLVSRYVDALKQEIKLYSSHPYFRNAKISSGYIGGGTPTTLRAEELDDLIGYFKSHFEFTDRASVTIESTPVDIDEKKLEALLKHGVDRVSMGVQTFHDPMLRYLGRARAHTGESARATIEMLHRNGMENICIDYMIGIPGQTQELWAQDVQTLMEVPVNSFSVYNYLVLPGSEAFFQVQSRITPPCPTTAEADAMYNYFVDKVLSNNYVAVTYNDFGGPLNQQWLDLGVQTYPVTPDGSTSYKGLDTSSFYLTDHLSHVWYQCGDLMALGSGAYGFMNHHMYLNEPNIERYIQYCGDERMPITMGAYADEYERQCRSMILGLKLLRVKRADFRTTHGVDMYDVFRDKIDSLIAKELVFLTDDAIQVTYPKGWFYIDNICKTFYSPRNYRLPQPSPASTEILNWQVQPDGGKKVLDLV
ncbi:MAG: coproporphyrinogen-III oxidase family protein [Pseudonocardiaceae bacterium]